MNQLVFQFPFKTTYFEQDFYVSTNNFEAYKLIESWPNWPDRLINIYGPNGCGKTHLANILNKKINSYLIKAKDLNEDIFKNIKKYDCVIIDEYNSDLDERFLYSILNQINQLDKYLLINSMNSIKQIKVNLNDLKSRFLSFIDLGIDLPTDDLLRVILTKSFSDLQIKVDIKLLEYILKNIDRSYEKIFQFIKDIDKKSLSSGKPINLTLVKNVLKQNEQI
ncbi:MAG: DNA replication protein [Pelagibacteraceae bacterium]